MSRLWVRVIKRHRIARQETTPCGWGEEHAALEEVLKEMDLPSPMWLSKHEKEYQSFRRTAFSPDHFIEVVDFDHLEIEFLDDSGKKHKSAGPRNQ